MINDYDTLLLSGFQHRNDTRMLDVISGMDYAYKYFGHERITVTEIKEMPVYVNGPIRLSGEYVVETVVEMKEVEVKVFYPQPFEVYVSGEMRMSGEYVEVDKIVYKDRDVYVSGEMRLNGEGYVEVDIPGPTVYVSGVMRAEGELVIVTEEKIVYVDSYGDSNDADANNYNNKPQAPTNIVYSGRTLKYVNNSQFLYAGPITAAAVAQYGSYTSLPNFTLQVPHDVRAFCPGSDVVLKYYIAQHGLNKTVTSGGDAAIKASYDNTVYAVQNWVMFGTINLGLSTFNKALNDQIKMFLTGNWNNQFSLISRPSLTIAGNMLFSNYDFADAIRDDPHSRTPVLRYSSDREEEQQARHAGRPTLGSYDYWQLPFESLVSGYGDCEDGAILIAALCINAGVPAYRIRICTGVMGQGSSSPGVAHVWCIYLTSQNVWKVIDWCNGQDNNESSQTAPVPIANKTAAVSNNVYGEVYFSFNSRFSWLGKPY
jgi:hypothetical protein